MLESSDALDIMKNTYGGPAWHYTSGENLGKGFGINSVIVSTIASIWTAMYWDLCVFAHEVG